MGDDAKAIDVYAKLFGVSPAAVRTALGSASPQASATPRVTGPAPGDPDFAASLLGRPAEAPMSKVPAGPAPGDKGFGLEQVANMGSPSAAPEAPPSSPKLPHALPAGAGQIDTSMVVPKGFASGAASIPNLPAGAGSVELSKAPPAKLGNKYAAEGNGDKPAAAGPSDINWGRGGGGTATIPAHEVPLATAARQNELLGAIDAQGKAVDAEGTALEGQKVAAGGAADAASDVERARGVGEIDAAKAAVDAGQSVKDRAKAAAAESKAYREHIDAFSEKVAKDKIDPNGMWNNASTGQKVTWTLAKMFGAVAQSFLHLPTNQIADKLEQMAAQDVAAQRANHEIGRERVADMNTMYGQALHATGSAEEAERVATGYGLEAVKHQAQALLQNASGKAQQAKGKEVIAEIEARQAALGERRSAVDEKKAETGIKLNPLAQARTVATGPDMTKVYATARQYTEEQAKLGTVVAPDAAIRWAYKMHMGSDPLPGAGRFVQGSKAEAGSNKEEKQYAIDEVNKQYDNMLSESVLDKLGFLPAVADSGGFQRLMPGSSAVLPQVTKFNLMMDSAAGKLLKDNEGRIPPPIVEQLHKFHVKPGDTKEFAQAQIEAQRRYVNSMALVGGSKGRDPSAGAPATFKPAGE